MSKRSFFRKMTASLQKRSKRRFGVRSSGRLFHLRQAKACTPNRLAPSFTSWSLGMQLPTKLCFEKILLFSRKRGGMSKIFISYSGTNNIPSIREKEYMV
jgi:hypothetical protein